jgi:ABC-type multidrug transport system ATPase subunit
MVTVKDATSERAADRTATGVRIEVDGLVRRVKDNVLLHDVSFVVEPGELVAIVGGSGAGKTTLLEAVAGVEPADEGCVRFDGSELYPNLEAFRSVLGYVPQDDIIHSELAVAATLRYAARLRLPSDTDRAAVDAAVERAMAALDLSSRAEVKVAALSGGQRKRASIAVELLTSPQVFFLDEPTSGLDPATGADLLGVMRDLTEHGATVVFTTHAVQDLDSCDRVVFLARGGHLAFVGSVDAALAYFEVERIEQIYGRLAVDATPEEWGERHRRHRSDAAAGTAADRVTGGEIVARRARPGAIRQWRTLTARTFHTMVHNRLTLAILLGSPVLVVAMFAVLFRAGAFDFDDPSPTAIVMILFWITFGSFFFGLTYGLLQICTERAILRREHLVGLRLGPYLASKVTVLLPFLLLVNAVMLAVLRALDRLPAASLSTYLSVGVTLALVAAAALSLGLLTSAAVSNPAQATLALPMLCFPAVLFSGAIIPVNVMAPAGAAISALMSNRWGFEALGHDLGARRILDDGGSPLGPPLVASYGDSAASYRTPVYWAILAIFIAVFSIGALAVLHRTSRRSLR